jgi:hypothetical protein
MPIYILLILRCIFQALKTGMILAEINIRRPKKEVAMTVNYPTPKDVGIEIPSQLIEQRFNAGFLHALQGKQLSSAKHFRRSFRYGYREGKLYLREVRRAQGIIEFPFKAKMKFKAAA